MTIAASTKPTETHPEKLERLAAEVEALRGQLQRSRQLATLGTITAMVAHEFRNILTPLMNYARLAQENPALMDKAIARAVEGSERAWAVCEALLDLAGPDAPRPERANLAALVGQTLVAMGRSPQRDGIELSVSVPDNLIVVTRRVLLQQVLMNLLLNARAATLAKDRPRRIEITARQTRRETAIRVADSGVGIAPENLERIFEPFFTTKDGGDRVGEGSGLGLATCHELMSAIGGRVAVNSTLGEGTTFTLHIPA